jgi:hypothetical protein
MTRAAATIPACELGDSPQGGEFAERKINTYFGGQRRRRDIASERLAGETYREVRM